MNSSEISVLDDNLKKINNKVKNFSEILSGLQKTEDKKKILWKEIYENAIFDRENASILFTEAYATMDKKIDSHVLVGPTMAKYLERMCKSNEQILRLAEIISKVESEENSINTDDVFSKIKEKD